VIDLKPLERALGESCPQCSLSDAVADMGEVALQVKGFDPGRGKKFDAAMAAGVLRRRLVADMMRGTI